MKKFKFQLEAVLKVTKLKKERAEIAFAEAVDFLYKQQELLKKQQSELADAYNEYNKIALSGKVNVSMLSMYSSYFDFLKKSIQKQEQTVNEAEQAKQAKLQELQYEMSRLESIEKLKEKRKQEYWADVMAEEQKSLDEIGLQIYVRTTR